MKINIQGDVSRGFEEVARVFEEGFSLRSEVGASVCVWAGGQKVVDLWGGCADPWLGRPWERDTTGVVFSSTKGLVGIIVLMMSERGMLDYDAPVAQYWPEFAQNGKQDITVRTLMNHRSGLLTLDEDFTIADLEEHGRTRALSGRLAAQKTAWEPGSDQGYHGVTYGLYVGELVWRVAGRTVGQLLKDWVVEPLKAAGADVDAWLGLPSSERHRVARLLPTGPGGFLRHMLPRLATGLTYEGRVYQAMLRSGSPTQLAFSKPSELGTSGVANFGTMRVQALELPWGNGVTNARGLATIYAALIGAGGEDLPRLVSPEAIAPIMRRQSWSDKDRVLLKPLGWSQGFLKEETRLFSPNTESFGHPGAGGPLGWADPKAGVAIGYVMNKMDFRVRSLRALALSRAVYRCL